MNLDYVPLLRVMRDLHSIPRGRPPDFNGKKRFKQYLRVIFDYDREVCKLPLLLAMNRPARREVRDERMLDPAGEPSAPPLGSPGRGPDPQLGEGHRPGRLAGDKGLDV